MDRSKKQHRNEKATLDEVVQEDLQKDVSVNRIRR